MTATPQERRRALLAKSATPALVDALQTLELKLQPGRADEFERMTRAWIIDELERRFPAASDAVNDAFEKSETDFMAGGEYVEVDYVGVLVANIPTK